MTVVNELDPLFIERGEDGERGSGSAGENNEGWGSITILRGNFPKCL